MRYLLILFLSIVIASEYFAQDFSQYRIPDDGHVYEIAVWSVRKSPIGGQYHDYVGILDPCIQFVKSYFGQAGIKFEVCQVTYIDDYNYNTLTDEPSVDELQQIKKHYYRPHCINVYMQASNNSSTFNGICMDTPNRPAVFVNFPQPSALNYSIFYKMMLEYFGLYGTASYPATLEYANGSNGMITADSIWDTPADPFELIINRLYGYSPDTLLMPINPKPTYYYNLAKDQNGQYFNPMCYHIMANYPFKLEEKCVDLTHEQKQYIARNDRRCRHRRWH